MKLKKMLAAVLTMAMVATALPVTAFAATVNSSEDLAAAVANAGSEAVVIELASGEYATNFKVDGGKDITIKAAKGAEVVLSGQIATTSSTEGKLTLENVTYKVDNSIVDSTGISQTGKSAIAIWGNQTVICNNVTFDMSKADSSAITAWWDTGIGTTIECYNCTFNCNGQRPVRATGNVTMDNCTFNDPYRYAVQLTAKASTATLLDKAIINFTNNTIVNGENGKAFVYGIQLEGEEYGCNDLVINGSGNTIKNGGEDSTMYFCECGKVKHESVFWNVEETPVCGVNGEAVAKVAYKNGAIYYATLKDAVAAAGDKAVITLLKDTSGSGIVINKNITIDFGGNTYTFDELGVGSGSLTSNGFQILKDNTVTLMDGTLQVAPEMASAYYILVQNYANLTVDSMKLDGTNLDRWALTDGDSYVLSNNSGNVIVKDTEITKNDDGAKAFAFDVYDSANYSKKPVVTMSGNMVVNGPFEVSEGLEKNLKISGGKFKTEPTAYLVGGYTAEKEENSSYWVVAKIEDVKVDTTVDTTVSAPAIDTGSVYIPDANIEAAKTQEQDAGTKASMAAAASNVTVTVTEEEVKAALPADVVAAAAEQEKEITVEKQTYLDVEVEAYNPATKEMTVEIKAMCQPFATVTLNGDETPKTAPLGEPEEITVTDPVTVTIPLPDGFGAANGDIVYITHYKGEGANREIVAVHEAIVGNDGKTATFYNEHGFSTFVVSTDASVIAANGGDGYDTLEDAITHAASGDTIKLMMAVPLTEKVTVDKKITLDLNGFKITSDFEDSFGTIYVNNTGDLTITDSSEGPDTPGTGAIIASATYAVGNYGKVTVNGGTLTGGEECAALYNFYYKFPDDSVWKGESTVDGGNVNTVWNCGVLQVDSGNVGYIDNSGAAVVTGGTIGDIFAQDGGDASGEGTGSVTMTGGAVSGTIEAETGAGVMISGGSFAEEVDIAMLAPNANRVTNADGSSEVLTDADLTGPGNSVTLEAGEKLVDDEGKVLLNVTQGSATYSNGEITAAAGTVLNTTANGTVSFPYGGTISAGGSVDVNSQPRPHRVGGGSKDTPKEEGTDAPVATEKTLVLTIGQKAYEKDGVAGINDVAPIIQGDRTMLPIRLIAETLGATVVWNQVTQSVTIVDGDTTIVIVIGQATALVNGEVVQLDAPAFISNDRTYLPVRFIAENLGATVTWDGEANTVTIVG